MTFRLVLLLCAVAASFQAHAGLVRILVPVLDGTVEATKTYLYADNGGEPARVDAQALRPWIEATLSPDAGARFMALQDEAGTVALADTEKAGFTLTYDDELAALRIAVLPEALKNQAMSLQDSGYVPGQAAIAPADISGFVNFRGGVDYVHDNPTVTGRQPARLDMDGALNLGGWVLEGRADYLEGAERTWARDETRLVHDWPEKMVRLAVGDLSYPITGFQSYAPLLGISIARNFTLQPYRVTQPTGRTSFVINSPSRVDVVVNGQKVRTLQLQPGPYDISDFPVSDGSNNVTLVITDATGRVEQKTFPLVSDQKLLKKGLHEYAYNIGALSKSGERAIEYSTQPAFSAFHRYGLSDTLTAGGMLQADQDVAQIGASLVEALSWGTFGIETAASRSDDGISGASQISYGYHDSRQERDFVAALEYRGSAFSSLGQDDTANPVAWELTSRYTQPAWWDTTMSVGGRYRFAREDNPDEWSYSLNFSKVFYGNVAANLSFEQRSEEGAGVYMGVTWTPGQGRQVMSASVDTLTKTQDVNWQWRDDRHWQAGAGVARDDAQTQATGSIAYSGNRGEASFRDDITTALMPSVAGASDRRMTDHRSRILVATAIAFADDHVALSRPINSGFIMLAKNDNLRGHKIGINPTQNEDGARANYQAEINALGPAVIADAVPYIYRPINIDTHAVPAGYDIGQDNYIAMPGYKSGSVVTVGSSANVYADGYVTLADGKPAAMEAGSIACPARPEAGAQEFFTNAKGRFRISRLQPCAYELTLYSHPEDVMHFTIPDDGRTGRFDAGTIALATPSALDSVMPAAGQP